MNATIKLLVNLIYHMCGNNTYKVLRNWPDKKQMFLQIAATFDKLCVLNHDNSVVVGQDRVKDYQFIKSKILELMNQNYVILNDVFSATAELEDSPARLAEVYFKPEFADGFYREWFEVSEVKDIKTQINSVELLTASEWNSIWLNIATLSNRSWQFDNLHKKPLTIAQLPGVVDEVIEDCPRIFHDFQNDGEHSIEFVYLLNWNLHSLGALSASTEVLDEGWIKKHLKIDNYLFDDFRN